eukprot:9407983-Karenia_brevis.AAC.1
MPPCDTTQINMINHPNFSITINAPTKKQPSPPLPPQTIVTATHTMLPTPILTVKIAEKIHMAPGKVLAGRDLLEVARD